MIGGDWRPLIVVILHAYVCDFPTGAAVGAPQSDRLSASGSQYRRSRRSTVPSWWRIAFATTSKMAPCATPSTSQKPSCRETVAVESPLPMRTFPTWWGKFPRSLPSADLNIADLLNKSRGEVAYTIIDLDGGITEETLNAIRGIQGVLTLRHLPCKAS